MAYTSKVKDYGAPADERVERPATWRWKKDEPPVAEYLNDLYYNVIEDVQHLVALTNTIDPDNDGIVDEADTVDGLHASELGGFHYNQSTNPQTPDVGNTWFKDTNGLIFVGDGSRYNPQPEVGYQETETALADGYAVAHETPTQRTKVTTDGRVVLINEQTVVDFENGITPSPIVEKEVWSWTDSSGLTAQGTQVISGSQSGEFEVVGTLDTITLNRETPIIQDFEVSVQVGSDTGNISDYAELVVLDQSGATIAGVRFNDGNGNVQILDDTLTAIAELQSAWSVDTTYAFEWDWDFANSQYDLYMDGALVGTYAMPTGIADFGTFEVTQDNSNAGATRSVFIDDLHTGAREAGEAVFTAPTPDERITYWDTIRLFRAANTETMQVDIEDEAGAVLLTNVQSEDDLSAYVDAATNFQLRLHFARDNNANHPEFSGLYRRWTHRPGDTGMSNEEKTAWKAEADRARHVHTRLARRI